MINFFAGLFALAFGFGLAFWICGNKLNKSNNIGDSRGGVSDYKAYVSFTARKDRLNKEERGILSGHNDVSDYSLEHLYHIKEVCEKTNDDHNLEIINLLIQYVEHPESLYIVKSHDEALELIDKLMVLPIRTQADGE